MTSHLINYFLRRLEAHNLIRTKNNKTTSTSSSTATLSSTATTIATEGDEMFNMEDYDGKPEPDCAFCQIVRGESEAIKVYEDEWVLAFFDILPIRPGHLLVVPKSHYARLTHLPDSISSRLGEVLPRLSRALCIATGQPDFNVVSNQGYAQIVHHLHLHLVPAPFPNAPHTPRSGWASIIGREELDEDEAEELAVKIRAAMVTQNSRRVQSKL